MEGGPHAWFKFEGYLKRKYLSSSEAAGTEHCYRQDAKVDRPLELSGMAVPVSL